MLRTLLLLTILPIVTLGGWLALGPSHKRADFVVASDVLRTIDPHRVSWMDEIQVAQTLFEGLTRLNSETLVPEPAVALRWDVDPSRTCYTFHLRGDARWSDGRPVTAEHFRYAWLRVLDPATESQYANLMFVIEGAEPYYRSRLNRDPADDAVADSVGLRAPDERTFEVRLRAPCPYLLDLTSFPTYAPLLPDVVERFRESTAGTIEFRRHLWTRPGNIVTNGAFVLESWGFKQSLLLRRNPHYWDRAGIAIDTIEVYLTGDPAAALVAYKTGRVDLVRTLDPAVARVLREKRGEGGLASGLHGGDRFATFFLRVNCRRPPLDDPRLRQALSLSVDRDSLCEHVLGLGETPANTFVPVAALPLMARSGPAGQRLVYHPPRGLGADLSRAQRVERARALLAESSYGRMETPRPLELAYAPDPPQQRRIAEALQSMWERNLGIRVELRVIERKVLSTRIRELDYDLARSDWFGDFMDPATFLEMFTTQSGQNRTGWSDQEYDRLVDAASRQADDAHRFELYRRAEQILTEQQLPIVPLFFRSGYFLLNPAFEGLHDNVREILPVHRVRRVDRPRAERPSAGGAVASAPES